ncbi:MAG: UbiX family flavin prenyltransferase [Bacillota bacterium]|jgi:4-hydroxy-3-polyprenylbenzoate decarboxylase
MNIVIAITGATGTCFGIRLLEVMKELKINTHLIISKWAQKTIELETSYSLDDIYGLATHYYDEDNQAAAIASGSFKHQGMVIIPCSMKTLGSIANGIADNLIHRSADVTLKEQRKLILAVRETPLNAIQLENMLKLSRLGVVIMPPVPAFYHKPQTISEIVDHFVGRILDQLNVEHKLTKPWGS